MDIQRKNQLKQLEETLEKRLQQQEQLAPVRVQNEYNKENLKLQHEFNLEIFKKQKRLTIIVTITTAICSFVTGIAGVLIGYYLNNTTQQQLI